LTAAEAQFGGSEERNTDYIAKLRFVAVPSHAGAGAILVYTDLPKILRWAPRKFGDFLADEVEESGRSAGTFNLASIVIVAEPKRNDAAITFIAVKSEGLPIELLQLFN